MLFYRQALDEQFQRRIDALEDAVIARSGKAAKQVLEKVRRRR